MRWILGLCMFIGCCELVHCGEACPCMERVSGPLWRSFPMYGGSVWSTVKEHVHVWRQWLYKISLQFLLFAYEPQCYLKNKKEFIDECSLFSVNLFLRIKNVTKLNAIKLKTVAFIYVCKCSTYQIRY